MTESWEPKERKSFPFELEEKEGVDSEERTFKGFAAVMGNFDGRDIIEKGAFKKTIKEMGNRVKVYWIHDWQNPIGTVKELKEVTAKKLPQSVLDRAPDATGGLHVKGYISRIPQGDRALEQMRDGTLNEMSIGYDPVKEEWEKNEEGVDVRHLKEVKLFDVSPVPLAMNPAAIVTEVKSKWEEKVEETDDFIHVPAPGEEGKHEGHRIRYIDIDKDKGIRAKYCGECKVIISYVFDKEKGWTVKKAVAWVKEHHEKSIETIMGILKAEEEMMKAAKFRAITDFQRKRIKAKL